MKKSILILFVLCCFVSVNAQEGYGEFDRGPHGESFLTDTDYEYSAFVLKGPNQPRNEGSKRDLVFKFRAAGKSIIRSYGGTSWDTYLQFLTTPNLDPLPQVRMHISDIGNVGIGTTTPLEKLDVVGKIRTEDINLRGKIGRDLIYPFSYNNTTIDHFSLSWVKDPDIPESDGYSMWASAFGGMKFFTNSLPRLMINKIGNVGIGTTNPQNMLDVNGTIRAKEIKVESGWADFVFKKGYKLPTLEEVEQHINEKGTLPNVPTEDDVKANGVNLSEMNTMLLQKIEELTLYMIELKKENTQIKEQLGEFRNKIN